MKKLIVAAMLVAGSTATAQDYLLEQCRAIVNQADADYASKVTLITQTTQVVAANLAEANRLSATQSTALEDKMKEIFLNSPTIKKYAKEKRALTRRQKEAGLGRIIENLLYTGDFLTELESAANKLPAGMVGEIQERALLIRSKYDLDGISLRVKANGSVRKVNDTTVLQIRTYVDVDGLPYLLDSVRGLMIINLETGAEIFTVENENLEDWGASLKKKTVIMESPLPQFLTQVPQWIRERDEWGDVPACRAELEAAGR